METKKGMDRVVTLVSALAGFAFVLGFVMVPVVQGAYYGVSGSAGLFNYTNQGIPTLLNGSLSGQSLALDETNSHIYVGTNSGIVRTDLSGGNAFTVIAEGDPIYGVTLDVSNSKIYYSVSSGSSGNRAMKSINFDGTGQTTIVNTGGFSLPRQSAVNFVDQKIYWVDTFQNTINRRNLDGSGSTESFTDASAQPQGIAVDGVGGKVYWTGAASGELNRANLDGSSQEVLISGLSQPLAMTGYFSEGKLLFVNGFNPRTLVSVNTDGTNQQNLFLVGSSVQAFGDAAAIPEPSTYALIASVLALAGVLFMRMRKRAAAES